MKKYLSICLMVIFLISSSVTSAWAYEEPAIKATLLVEKSSDRAISFISSYVAPSAMDVFEVAGFGLILDNPLLEPLKDTGWDGGGFEVEGFVNPSWKYANNPLVFLAASEEMFCSQAALFSFFGANGAENPPGLLSVELDSEGEWEGSIDVNMKRVPLIKTTEGRYLTFDKQKLMYVNGILTDREQFDGFVSSLLYGNLADITSLVEEEVLVLSAAIFMASVGDGTFYTSDDDFFEVNEEIFQCYLTSTIYKNLYGFDLARDLSNSFEDAGIIANIDMLDDAELKAEVVLKAIELGLVDEELTGMLDEEKYVYIKNNVSKEEVALLEKVVLEDAIMEQIGEQLVENGYNSLAEFNKALLWEYTQFNANSSGDNEYIVSEGEFELIEIYWPISVDALSMLFMAMGI